MRLSSDVVVCPKYDVKWQPIGRLYLVDLVDDDDDDDVVFDRKGNDDDDDDDDDEVEPPLVILENFWRDVVVVVVVPTAVLSAIAGKEEDDPFLVLHTFFLFPTTRLVLMAHRLVIIRAAEPVKYPMVKNLTAVVE